jgi:NTE family protein
MHHLKRLRVVHIRASQDIGAMAAAYARSPEFAARAPGMIGKVVRRISEWEGAGEADLLSYILFDGEFSARLIELGRNDARARHAELCTFFEEVTPKDKNKGGGDGDAVESAPRPSVRIRRS